MTAAPGVQQHRFAAMGTSVECLVEARPSAALRSAFRDVEAEFARLERKLSRFRDDSELSRLNRERSIEASDDLLELVRLALDARERSGGRFDPTLHDALVAAGYDRTFTEVENVDLDDAPKRVRRVGHVRHGLPATPPRATRRDLRFRGRRIELGPGASLDLGGIAKGWAADRCLSMLAVFGPALINAGGDLAVSGPRAAGPWAVGVDVPQGTLTLALDSGGLATSGRDRRRWRRGGEERHHIIDPRTLRPAEGGPLSVTVAAASATEAEVAAKKLFLAASPAREAASAGTPAVIVAADGRVRLVGVGQ